MADDTDKSDFTDDEGKSGNENPFGTKPKHHKGIVSLFFEYQVITKTLVFFAVREC